MNRKFVIALLSIFLFLILINSLYAVRGIYIWSMAYQMTRFSSFRGEFYSFIKAPKGLPENEIKVLYFNGYQAINYEVEKLKEFIADMHSRGLSVYCLAGDPLWASSTKISDGTNFCDQVLSYNTNAGPEERFDGIIYDIEPYGLGDWDSNKGKIWTNYIALLRICKNKVESYNAVNDPDIEFGDSIPVWYDTDSTNITDVREVQSNTHFVVLMDYSDNSNNQISRATNECINADELNTKVIVASETYDAVNDSETYWEEGNTVMEASFSAMNNVTTGLAKYSNFTGTAVHFYEQNDIENSYRNLTPQTPNAHNNAPVVFLTAPNGDEGLSYSSNMVILWTSADYDGDSLSINVQYSSNKGTNWYDCPSTDQEGNAKSTDDGRYVWDLTSIPEGTGYKIRLIARDSTYSNDDKSDYTLRVVKTAQPNTNEWSGIDNTANEGCKAHIIYDDQNSSVLHLAYYTHWAAGTKGIYYKQSTDGGNSWGGAVAVDTDNGTLPRKPSMYVRNGKIAITYLRGPDYQERVYLATNIGSGTTFATQRIDDGSANEKNFPDIAIDSLGNYHVVWLQNTGSRVLKYRMKTNNGNWSSISDLETYAWIIKHPAICVDDADNIHVVYDRRSWAGAGSRSIRYNRKAAGGTWGGASTLWTGTGDNDWQNILAPDIIENNNRLHVVFHTSWTNPDVLSTTSIATLYYMRKTNTIAGVWSIPVTIGTGYTACVSGDDTDNLHVVWYDARNAGSGSILYRYSDDNGTTFQEREELVNDADMPYYNSELVNPYVSIPYVSSAPNGVAVICWRDDGTANIEYIIKTSALSAPQDVSVKLIEGSISSLNINWTKPAGYYPNKYKVYRATDFNTNYSLVDGNVYASEYNDTGLSTNSQYKYKVEAVLMGDTSKRSKPSNLLTPGTRFLINYFEGNEEIPAHFAVGNGISDYGITNSDAYQGTNALAVKYSYTSGWGGAVYAEFPTSIDISDMNLVQMRVKGDGSTNKLKIGFVESFGGDPEVYVSKLEILLTNSSWMTFQYLLADFEKTSGTGDGVFDKDRIGRYQLTYTTRDTSTAYHFIDQVELIKLASTISLSTNSVNFGNIKYMSNDKRVQSIGVSVTYENLPQPWTIRIYTDDGNEGTQNAGLQGQRFSGTWLPIKVWCENFGPVTNTNSNMAPSEENEYFWSGYDFNTDSDKIDSYTSGTFTEGTNTGEYPFDIDGDGYTQGDTFDIANHTLTEEAVWSWVPEKNEMNPFNHYTWRRLSYTGAELPSGFKFFLGIDLTGVQPQQYIGTIVVEVLIE